MSQLSIREIPAELIKTAKLKLASNEEDSSLELEVFTKDYEPLLSTDKFKCTAQVGNRSFTFDASVEEYDFNTHTARFLGNSPAWEFNQVRQYRVWRNVAASEVLASLGVNTEQVPATILSQEFSLCQNYTTDYRFANSVCRALGLRLAGDLSGVRGLLATYDLSALEPALTIGYDVSEYGQKANTSVDGVFLEMLKLSQADSQESAKDGASSNPDVASEATPTASEQPKYRRIDPATGSVYQSTSDTVPVSSEADKAAKIRQLEWDITLNIDIGLAPEFLLQPGDAITLVLGSTELGTFVDTAEYEFEAQYTRCTLDCKQPDAKSNE